LSETVLKGEDDLLPARSAALARFAVQLTAQPWSIGPETGARLAAHGLGTEAIAAATGVVAMFNYLTRVADASGIEFDYESPLPAFQLHHGQEPVPRPERDSWPVVGAEFRTPAGSPALNQGWRRWHDYVFDSDEPLSQRERRLLASAAAQECCDRRRADELADCSPRDDRESTLDEFARKLSRRPWQMDPGDLQVLRDTGYPELALLHAISVVALQNAESRLAMGQTLTSG
jgi:hypothetical protein